MSGCPSSGKIVIGADFDFLNFRVAPQECFQCGRLFKRKGLRFLPFLGGVDPAKGQPPFIRSPFQRQMGKGFDGCFINRQPVGFPLGGRQKQYAFSLPDTSALKGFPLV